MASTSYGIMLWRVISDGWIEFSKGVNFYFLGYEESNFILECVVR